MSWLHLLLAVAAYRGLVTGGAGRGVVEDVEDWLFLPSDTSPTVVVLLAGWLLWRRRDRLAELAAAPAPGWLVAGLAAACAAVHLWALYTGAHDLMAPSLSLLLLCVAAGWRGTAALRVVALPAAILLFALPLPAPLLSQVVWSFQLWSADLSGWILLQLRVPTFVSGDMIYQANETFQVIETCSGLRSVETLTLLSVVMVDLFNRGPLHSLLIVGAAPFVAFGMNGVRVVTLTLNPHSEILEIHLLQGVAILLSGLITLYLLDGLLGRFLPSRPVRGPAPPGSGPGIPNLPATLIGRATAGLVAGLAVATVVMPSYRPPPEPVVLLSKRIPDELDGWKASPLPLDRWFLGSIGFQQSLSRRFEARGRGRSKPAVDVFVAIGDHNQRARSPFSPKLSLPGSGWTVVEEGRTAIGRDRLPARWREVRKRTRRRLVVQWYEGTAGLFDEVMRTSLGLDQSPFRRARPGLVYRLVTDLQGHGPESRREAEKRIGRVAEALRARLDGAWGPSV